MDHGCSGQLVQRCSGGGGGGGGGGTSWHSPQVFTLSSNSATTHSCEQWLHPWYTWVAHMHVAPLAPAEYVPPLGLPNFCVLTSIVVLPDCWSVLLLHCQPCCTNCRTCDMSGSWSVHLLIRSAESCNYTSAGTEYIWHCLGKWQSTAFYAWFVLNVVGIKVPSVRAHSKHCYRNSLERSFGQGCLYPPLTVLPKLFYKNPRWYPTKKSK